VDFVFIVGSGGGEILFCAEEDVGIVGSDNAKSSLSTRTGKPINVDCPDD